MSAFELKFLAFRVYRFADTKAFRQLHELHASRLRRYIAFKVNRPEDADELTSEVFLRAWEYMTAQKVDNVTAFFYRIARNLIADHYRKGTKSEPLTAALERTLEAPGSVARDIEIKEESDELLVIMRQLKPEHREVLLMRYQDEMNIKEIADALEKTPNAIRVLLHRAKQALKRNV
jgi:RNA polymerase sigma-70 factor (ECF subfamily)